MQVDAAVAREKDAPFSLEKLELADIRDDEILVQLLATGICHTDLSILKQHFPLPLPYVLGHEGVGVVKRVGDAVRELNPGDKVVLSFESCGSCTSCGSGHPAYCDHYGERNYGRQRQDGSPYFHDAGGEPLAGRYLGQSSFASHVIATPRNAIKVDDDVDLPMLCGMGCGFMTGAAAVQSLDDLRSDATIAVAGMGALGFAALLMARERGIGRIVAIDKIESRLALALELGATDVIDTSKQSLSDRLSELGGADACVDTTGYGPVIEEIVKSLKRRGTLVLLGGSSAPVAAINTVSLIQGKTIRGEIFGDADPHTIIPQLIEMYRAGRFPVDRLIRRFRFDEINDAAASAERGDTVKPVLIFD